MEVYIFLFTEEIISEKLHKTTFIYINKLPYIMDFIEWVVVVMLSLAIIKNLTALLAPRILRNFAKSMISSIGKGRKGWVVFYVIFAGFFIYLSFIANMSISQWFIAAYTGIILFFLMLLTSNKSFRKTMKSFLAMSNRTYRIIGFVVVVLSSIAIYYIFN